MGHFNISHCSFGCLVAYLRLAHLDKCYINPALNAEPPHTIFRHRCVIQGGVKELRAFMLTRQALTRMTLIFNKSRSWSICVNV